MIIVRIFDAFVRFIQWLLTRNQGTKDVIDLVEVDGVWQLETVKVRVDKYV